MKDFEMNTISVNNILHTLRECERDQKYEGMFDHMLTFASELTGLSEDALVDAMHPQAKNDRLSALRTYKDNDEMLKRAEEEAKQNKANALIAQIQALKPRIDELIATGNACLESNIPLTGQAWGAVENYGTNQFFTNSWSHLVGFVGNPNRKPCHIEFLGINAGGACGVYNFRTDGTRVFSVDESRPGDITEPSIGHMQRFLNSFDEFESAFFSYVDQVVAKQQKSVDNLIAGAQEKAAMQNDCQSKTPVTAKDTEREAL